MNSEGSFSYTPNAGFTGTDSFTYVANDGQLNSNVATVSIDVTAVGGGNEVGVALIQTGELTGKGKNKTFAIKTEFAQGDAVIIRATVRDDLGNPVQDATVTLDIGGTGSATVTSGPSDAEGIAEASWNTSAPDRKGNGGTPTGGYTVTTSKVEATGYTWDGAATSAGFNLNNP